MTMKQQRSLPESEGAQRKPRGSSLVKLSLSSLFLGSIVLLFFLMKKDWENAVTASCIIYTVATGFFFIAQLAGFVLSQTEYNAAVETAKYTMLENERKQWET